MKSIIKIFSLLLIGCSLIITSCSDTDEKLKNQKDNLISYVDGEIDTLETSLVNKINETLEKINELELEYNEKVQELTEIDNEINTLQEDHSIKINSLYEELTSLKNQYDKKVIELEKIDNEIQQLIVALEEQIANQDKINEETHSNLLTDIANVNNALIALEEKHDKEVKALTETQTSLQTELNALNEQIAKQDKINEETHSNLLTEITDVNNALASLEEKHDKEVKALTETQTNLQAELDALEEQIAKQDKINEEAHSNLLTEITNVTNALASLEGKHDKEVKVLTETQTSLQAELDALEEQIAQQNRINEEKHSSLLTEITNVNNALASLEEKYNKEVKALTETQTSLEAELDALEEQIAKQDKVNEETHSNLITEIANVNNALISLEEKHDKEVKALTETQINLQAELDTLEEQIAKQDKINEEKHSNLTTEITNVNNALTSLKEKHDKEVKALTEAKMNLESEIAEIENKISNNEKVDLERYNDLLNNLSEINNALASLEEKHNREVKALTETQTSLQSELDALELQIAKQDKVNAENHSELLKNISNINEELDLLEEKHDKEVKALTETQTSLQLELDALEEQIAKQDKINEETHLNLITEIANVNNALVSFEEKHNKEVKALTETQTSLQAELDALEEQIAKQDKVNAENHLELLKNISNINEELDLLEEKHDKEVEALTETQTSLQSELGALEEQIAKQDKINAENHSNLLTEISNVNNELTSLEEKHNKEVKALTETQTSLQAELNALEEQIAKQDKINEEKYNLLVEQLTETQELIDETNQNYNAVFKNIEGSIKTINDKHSQDIETLTNQKNYIVEELDSIKLSIESLNDELSKEISYIKTSLVGLETTLNNEDSRLQGEIDKLNNLVDTLSTLIETNNGKITELQDELENLRNELEEKVCDEHNVEEWTTFSSLQGDLFEKGYCTKCDDLIIREVESDIEYYSGDDFTYEYIIADEVAITSYVGSSTEVEVPGYIIYNGFKYRVTRIDGLNSNITSVRIPNTIINIKESLFKNYINLTSVTLPNSIITIGKNAFYGCNSLEIIYYEGTADEYNNIIFDNEYSNPYYIQKNIYVLDENGKWCMFNGRNIIIPEGVSVINDINNYTIESSQFIESVTIPNSVTQISNGAFDGCDNLKNVYYEGTIEDWCNITIDYDYPSYDWYITSSPMRYASNFYLKNENNIWYKLTDLEIPDTITSIGYSQFEGFSGIKTLTFGKNTINFEADAFAYCESLETIYFNGTIDDWFNLNFSGSSTQFSVARSNPCSYASKIYMLNENNEWYEITEVVVPETVKRIKTAQFQGFEKLTSIVLHNNITSIGDFAFSNCKSLTNIELSSSLTGIGMSAFEGCISLKEINIPEGVGSIDQYTFSGCHFEIFYWPKSLDCISYFGLSACSMETIVYNGTYEEWSQIYVADEFIIEEAMGAKLILVEFNDFDLNTTIIVPYGVEEIEDISEYYTGNDISMVNSVVIPSSVNCFGYGCLDNMPIYENLYFTGTIEDWFNINFACYDQPVIDNFFILDENNEWYAPSSIEIPETIKTIKEYTFLNFRNIEKLYIHKETTYFPFDAFYNFLTPEVYYYGTLTDWCKVKIEWSSSPILGQSLFLKNENNEWYDVTELTNIEIPNTITSIGDSTFKGFNKLETLMIPEGVVSIGYYAFSGCTSLTTIYLPKTLKYVYTSSISTIKDIYYNGTLEDWTNITFENEFGEPSNVTGNVYMLDCNICNFLAIALDAARLQNDSWCESWLTQAFTAESDGSIKVHTVGIGEQSYVNQINLNNLPIVGGNSYTLTFKVKSTVAFNASFIQNQNPYTSYASASIAGTGDWETITMVISAPEVDPVNKLTMELGLVASDITFWIRNLYLIENRPSTEKADTLIEFGFSAGTIFYIDGEERPSVTVSEGAEYEIRYSSDATGYDSTEFPTEPGTYSMVVTVTENDTYNAGKAWLWFRLESSE